MKCCILVEWKAYVIDDDVIDDGFRGREMYHGHSDKKKNKKRRNKNQNSNKVPEKRSRGEHQKLDALKLFSAQE